jgi:hypothetical protein
MMRKVIDSGTLIGPKHKHGTSLDNYMHRLDGSFRL